MGWKEGTVFLDTGFSYTTSNQASIGTIWWSDTRWLKYSKMATQNCPKVVIYD
jgi:Tol biopolymer transport system component